MKFFKLIPLIFFAIPGWAQDDYRGMMPGVLSITNTRVSGDTLLVGIDYESDSLPDPPGGFDIWIMQYNSGAVRRVDQGERSRIAAADRLFKITDFHDDIGVVHQFDPKGFYSLKVEARYVPWYDYCDSTQWQTGGVMGGGCWPLSQAHDYFYIDPNQHKQYSAALGSLTDTTAYVQTNARFNVIVWGYHLPLSSRSENGVDVLETLYFTDDPDSSKISWRKLIVDGSWYYRNKYLARQKQWVDDNPHQVAEILERTAYKLVYRLRDGGTPLVTVRLKHGRVTEIWNYNID